MSQQPHTSVLTVTYGARWPQLEATITSALRSGCRVTVVSNGSAPSTTEPLARLEQDEPLVDVVWFDENMGSSPAFAAGLTRVYDHGLGVLILDDDNPLDDGTVTELLALEQAVRDDADAPHPFALEIMRPVNTAHRALAEGQRASQVFAELRPGTFQGFDLRSRLRRGPVAAVPGVLDERHEVTVAGSLHRLCDIPNAMWGGLYLPADVAALRLLPNPDLVLYGDDNDISRKLREAGVRILLDLDLRITDSIEWRETPGVSGWRSKLPSTLHLEDSELWRVSYLFRNQAYLSAVQTGSSASDRAALGVNATVKLAAFLAASVPARRERFAWEIVKASVRGVRGRLGHEFPLP